MLYEVGRRCARRRMQASTQRVRVQLHAPLPVRRRPERPIARACGSGGPAGPEHGDRPAALVREGLERPRHRLVRPGLAASLGVPATTPTFAFDPRRIATLARPAAIHALAGKPPLHLSRAARLRAHRARRQTTARSGRRRHGRRGGPHRTRVPGDGTPSTSRPCCSTCVSGPSLFRPYSGLALGRTVNLAAIGSPTSTPHSIGSDTRHRRRVPRAASRRFSRPIIDDPPAIFLAWSERARAVSNRFVVPPTEPGTRHPEHACASGRPATPARDARAATDAHDSGSGTSPPASRCSSRVAAVVPLLAYGVVSILSLQRGTREIGRHRQPERRHARRRGDPPLRRRRNAELLKALAADLQDTGLEQLAAGPHPQELRPAVPRVPRDHAVRRGGRDRRHEPHRQAARRASRRTRR